MQKVCTTRPKWVLIKWQVLALCPPFGSIGRAAETTAASALHVRAMMLQGRDFVGSDGISSMLLLEVGARARAREA